MSITVLKADVKRKCGIETADTSHDADIDDLIDEMLPGIEYTIADKYINDTGNTNLQKILMIGSLEIISGEFLQQLSRSAGSSESFSVGGITIGVREDHGGRLIEQGNNRLIPFRKAIDGMSGEASIQSTSANRETKFSAANTEVL